MLKKWLALISLPKVYFFLSDLLYVLAFLYLQKNENFEMGLMIK